MRPLDSQWRGLGGSAATAPDSQWRGLGGSAVRPPHSQWRGLGGLAARPPDSQWRGLGGSAATATDSQWRGLGGCWPLLPGAYARGSKRSHTGGKCVICHGLPEWPSFSLPNQWCECAQLDKSHIIIIRGSHRHVNSNKRRHCSLAAGNHGQFHYLHSPRGDRFFTAQFDSTLML